MIHNFKKKVKSKSKKYYQFLCSGTSGKFAQEIERVLGDCECEVIRRNRRIYVARHQIEWALEAVQIWDDSGMSGPLILGTAPQE